jgi:putative aldouronate transport system permease protein
MKGISSFGGHIFKIINNSIMFLFCIVFLYPFIYTIALSFSDATHILTGSVYIIPRGFTISAYKAILSDRSIINSLIYTIMLTVFGVSASIIMTIFAAYPLSRPGLKGSGIILHLIIFTMIFNGGLIPTYMVVKRLGLVNTMGALIFPDVIMTFLLIIMITYFKGMPIELEESAKVEGCTNIGILIRIIIPLAKPVIATLVIYYAVHYWNMFQQALIYIQSPAKYTLQIKLYQVLSVFMTDIINSLDTASAGNVISENVKAAMVIVTTAPIAIIYPFLQKYFIQGMTLGALKG